MGSCPRVVDWNSDGEWDIISGDRNGYLNVFVRDDTLLTGYKQLKLTDSTVLDVGGNSEPNVFDWNNDGKKDLVIGIESYNVRVYLNQTSDTWPMFQDYFTVNAGGSPIYLYRVNPYVLDLDKDGRTDLVCGENNGYVHFYRNLGPDSAPVFARGETLKLENGTPLRWARTAYYYGSRCGFGDWNNDGTPDFLLSTYEGQVELYLGVEPTGIGEERGVSIAGLAVGPVPAGPVVSINVSLNRPAQLVVCDEVGRPVRNLGTFGPGAARLTWDGSGDDGRALPAGVYFCRVSAGGETRTARVVLAR